MKKFLTALAVFALVAPIAPPAFAKEKNHPAPAPTPDSPSDYYTNSAGNQVHRPVFTARAPEGATAKCRDGSYSFSQSRRGTCSHHGGVAAWL